MPPSRDDDLDWLYGRDRPTAAPEPTRVMPAGPPRVPPGGDDHPRPVADHPVAVQPAAAPVGEHARPLAGPGTLPPLPPLPPTAPAPGAPGAGGHRRQRRPARTVLRVLVLLVVLSLAWLVAVPAHAWSQVDRADDSPGGGRPGNQPGQTFLLVGSDSREGLTKAQRKTLGTGSAAGQRTDTIMLLHVPPGGEPALISIPRDSYLPVPGHGRDKINAAFAFGGAKLLEQTVEQSTGLRVDGYLEIGFGGFVQVVDALDGIRMCVPKAIKDRDSHLDLQKGCQTMTGTTALGYVRMRKADPRGDLGRVERQRAVLAAVAHEAASPATVVNPVRYWRLNHAAAQSVTVGQDTSLWQVGRLALAMRAVAAGDGLTLTVPVSDPGAATPVGSAVLWDEDKAAAMFADIARGDTSKLSTYTR